MSEEAAKKWIFVSSVTLFIALFWISACSIANRGFDFEKIASWLDVLYKMGSLSIAAFAALYFMNKTFVNQKIQILSAVSSTIERERVTLLQINSTCNRLNELRYDLRNVPRDPEKIEKIYIELFAIVKELKANREKIIGIENIYFDDLYIDSRVEVINAVFDLYFEISLQFPRANILSPDERSSLLHTASYTHRDIFCIKDKLFEIVKSHNATVDLASTIYRSTGKSLMRDYLGN